MSSFNPRKARTKYALPLWVDAFVRDTLDLSADEIGAYNLILYAMWTRESCDLQDDDRKLARVARSTPQTWKRRIRPALEPFFDVENGVWVSRRLRREAAKTEKFLSAQSARRSGSDSENDPFTHHGGAQLDDRNIEENSRNTLKTNDPPSTADNPVDAAPDRPTQETKSPSIGSGGGNAGASSEITTYRERLLIACNVDPVSGLTGHGSSQLGTRAQMIEADRWITDLGLSENEVIEAVAGIVARKRDGAPNTLSYFTPSLQRLAAELQEAKSKAMSPQALRPIEGGSNDFRNQHAPRGPSSGGYGHGNSLASIAARRRLAGEV